MTDKPTLSLNERFAAIGQQIRAEQAAANGQPAPAPPATLTIPTGAVSRPVDERGMRWARRKLDEQAAALARMAPNTGRNTALNNAAYSCARLIPGGWLTETDVRTTLLAAALASGLEDAETRATLDSALQAGVSEPRDPPQREDAAVIIEPFEVPAGVDPATGEVLQPPTPARTSWWPKDISGLIDGDADPEPPPAFLRRDDGHHLLYAGKINALIGESESGKSWIALLGTAQTLQAGQPATYLDFEDTAPGVIERLRLLGVTDTQLRRLAYISPLDAYTAQAQGDLAAHLAQHQPAFISFDGINAAMTLLGLNLLDNMDYTSFSLSVLRPLARTGAAVVTVDHVTKNKEGRGAYAIGAQAKRADIDGCALIVEVDRPFGRGMTGRLKLTVSKDRPGHVRAVSAGGKNAGVVVLVSGQDGTITGHIEAPDLRPTAEKPAFRPTHIMQEVSQYLERVGPDGASQSDIEREIGRNAVNVRLALKALETDGYTASRIGPRNAILSTSIKPYRELDEALTTTPSDPVRPRPTPSDGRGAPRSNDPVSPSPSLQGDGDGVGEPVQDGDEREPWWQR